jgi:hypothetical protein
MKRKAGKKLSMGEKAVTPKQIMHTLFFALIFVAVFPFTSHAFLFLLYDHYPACSLKVVDETTGQDIPEIHAKAEWQKDVSIMESGGQTCYEQQITSNNGTFKLPKVTCSGFGWSSYFHINLKSPYYALRRFSFSFKNPSSKDISRRQKDCSREDSIGYYCRQSAQLDMRDCSSGPVVLKVSRYKNAKEIISDYIDIENFGYSANFTRWAMGAPLLDQSLSKDLENIFFSDKTIENCTVLKQSIKKMKKVFKDPYWDKKRNILEDTFVKYCSSSSATGSNE